MRICHVIESSSGGSSQIVVDLLRHGVAAGDAQTLIYSPLRAEPPFLRAVAALGDAVHVHPLPMRREVGLGDAPAALRLRGALRALGPFDIIHSHSSKAGALTRLAGLLATRAAQVYTPHAFVTMAPGAPASYGAIEWLASWFCDAIVVGSAQERDHARSRLRIAERRLRLIPMGVDPHFAADRGEARRRMRVEAQDYLVGFVGRLVAQKNPARLARVLALVAAAAPTARFAVVGEGPLRSELERAALESGVGDRLAIFAGCDARELMPGFDCLVCTSDYESFGLIFPEALAAGVPIVAPPVGVAAEAAIDGETGFLTGFAPSEIAEGVLKLAALDAPARAAMAEQCRLRARRFDFAETARLTRALYESLAAKAS